MRKSNEPDKNLSRAERNRLRLEQAQKEAETATKLQKMYSGKNNFNITEIQKKQEELERGDVQELPKAFAGKAEEILEKAKLQQQEKVKQLKNEKLEDYQRTVLSSENNSLSLNTKGNEILRRHEIEQQQKLEQLKIQKRAEYLRSSSVDSVEGSEGETPPRTPTKTRGEEILKRFEKEQQEKLLLLKKEKLNEYLGHKGEGSSNNNNASSPKGSKLSSRGEEILRRAELEQQQKLEQLKREKLAAFLSTDTGGSSATDSCAESATTCQDDTNTTNGETTNGETAGGNSSSDIDSIKNLAIDQDKYFQSNTEKSNQENMDTYISTLPKPPDV